MGQMRSSFEVFRRRLAFLVTGELGDDGAGLQSIMLRVKVWGAIVHVCGDLFHQGRAGGEFDLDLGSVTPGGPEHPAPLHIHTGM